MFQASPINSKKSCLTGCGLSASIECISLCPKLGDVHGDGGGICCSIRFHETRALDLPVTCALEAGVLLRGVEGVNGGRRVFEDEGNDVLQLLAQVLRRGRAGRRIVGPPSTKRRRELGMELGHVLV